MTLIELIKKHEGIKLKPYLDTVGKLTIGYGRNLTDVGITMDEAEYLLRGDINKCITDLDQHVPWWIDLSENRKMVMADMCFNLGISGLILFRNTLRLIQEGNYEESSREMLKSKWATQVGDRAIELSDMMRNG